ncbi:uncharacterized protein LOC124865191 isoform X2 [Girardinichthys multiradiatus]|uniref:uncharacterized protein LOC124865191 isoform X2 n=1 Tax=Girardinichthys multiradiatus TaxID=208333 RepID=UPI001FAB78A4|nr:uncharacterized protein LOC124865191 isoform X2 [Girardinichthys multiradiatus]
MASAGDEAEDDVRTQQRRNSPGLDPPDFSELRVVLLGNSWSERRSVGNFILKEKRFITEKATGQCEKFITEFEEKTVTIINTPDLLQANVSADKLNEHVETCVRFSYPGPHVFLLVLQPENFTEEQKLRLCGFLTRLSDRWFDHSMVLISTLRERSEADDSPDLLLKEMIVKCQYRHLKLKNIDHLELLKCLGQIIKENNGYLSCDVFKDAEQRLTEEDVKQEEASLVFSPTQDNDGLRIVIFGKSEYKKNSLCNFIMKKKQIRLFKRNPSKHSVVSSGAWGGEPLKVVKSPDIFSLSVETLIEKLQSCMTLCLPGPNVLLLLVKPSEFTEKNRKTLKFVLSLFHQDAFKYAMVVTTHEHEMSPSVNELLKECAGRYYSMFREDHNILMQEIENILDRNGGTFLTFRDEISRPQRKQMKPPLNLVLFGRRGAGKTLAAKVILGQTELHSASNSSKCVRNQGQVCGRWVSLVELPALYGEAQQKVMEKSFRCISLCDPEGVHAFILVLPLGPLTDEDKGELQTIQDTFSSRVNDFTMVLFTVESDPKHPAVVNFVSRDRDIQKLCQSFGERYVVVNMKDRQQIPELLEKVDRSIIHKNSPFFYTSETFIRGQIQKSIQQDERITRLEAEMKKLKKTPSDLCKFLLLNTIFQTRRLVQCCSNCQHLNFLNLIYITGAESDQSSKCLRIVLIGKTGCGKSSSGNTILGRKVFKAETNPKSVTKHCQKEQCEVDDRPVAVVDTPGLFDDSLTHEEINEETLKCMSILAPGPHVFLLVLRIGRLTPEEKETLKLIKEGFGKDAEKFTILLFTNGDTLEHDEQTIESYIEKDKDFLEKLISDCGGRYHVFNNHDKQNRTQVSELIRKIDTMVKQNGGSCYTNEMLQEAETAIRKKAENILKETEEEMKREKEELKRKYDEEMQEMKRKMEEQKEKLRQEADKKLKEMKEHIDKEHKQREKEQEEREKEKRKRETDEKTHRQNLIRHLEILEKQVQSEKEDKKSVNRVLEMIRKEKEKYKEAWEKERREWWEKQKEEEEKRKQEEQRKRRELEEQYKKEIERYEEERKMEEQIRREQEEKERKILEEKLEGLQKEYEEKAREEAVKSNEFQEKYKKEFEAQKEVHEKQMKDQDEKYDLLKVLAAHKEAEKRKRYQAEMNNLVKCVSKKKENLTEVKDLLVKHEQELNQKKTQAEKEELQKNHETEISEPVEKLLKAERKCLIL